MGDEGARKSLLQRGSSVLCFPLSEVSSLQSPLGVHCAPRTSPSSPTALPPLPPSGLAGQEVQPQQRRRAEHLQRPRRPEALGDIRGRSEAWGHFTTGPSFCFSFPFRTLLDFFVSNALKCLQVSRKFVWFAMS